MGQRYPSPYSKRDPTVLTIKQARFVDEFLQHGNKSQAYRAAYNCVSMTPKTISRRAVDVSQKSRVRAAIDVKRHEIAAKVMLDRAWVLERLMENAEVALGWRTQRQMRIVGNELVEVEAHFPDRASANRALELIGKEIGMFVNRLEVGGPGEFDSMTDKELRVMIESELAELLPSPSGK